SVACTSRHRCWSPARQASQCRQLRAFQPSPTRWPIATPLALAPSAVTRPTASWPGTNGYWVKPHSLSSIDRSEWQTPQCSTVISTSSAPSGPGSYSKGSSGAPAVGAAHARYRVMTVPWGRREGLTTIRLEVQPGREGRASAGAHRPPRRRTHLVPLCRRCVCWSIGDRIAVPTSTKGQTRERRAEARLPAPPERWNPRLVGGSSTNGQAAGVHIVDAFDLAGDPRRGIDLRLAFDLAAQRHHAVERIDVDVEAGHVRLGQQRRLHLGGDPGVIDRLAGVTPVA